MTQLCLRNRQRAQVIDLRLLRQITLGLLKNILQEPDFELGIHLVAAPEMAQINETFLDHAGSTDVITFDYSNNAAQASCLPFGQTDRRDACAALHGEIFISIDDAVKQAREFKTTWQSELVRYIVHGILHLQGFDDLDPAARRKMKREENRLLAELSRHFALGKLRRQPKIKNG